MISPIPRGKGGVYLATVVDCFSKMVVGFAMADHMRAGLVTGALRAAIERWHSVECHLSFGSWGAVHL
ncbi:MAG: DDE-type integrase/transposase/recombinase [Candidatus Microthrix sp.]|nr:DDE-type integrase/transposase/recombinase [Candidatus Microthrix sp.]